MIFRYDSAENSIMQTISIAVSAILIAAGLITAPSLISNSRDTNAKQDLANIAMAQEFALSDKSAYSSDVATLQTSGDIKLVLSAKASPGIITGTDCYAAFTRSASGTYFYRTSDSATVVKIPVVWPATKPAGYPINCSWPTTSIAAVGIPTTNILANSSFETDTSQWVADVGAPTLSSSSTVAVFGSKSLKLVGTNTSHDIAAYTGNLNLVQGTVHTVSWWVYSSDARNTYVDIAGIGIQMPGVGLKAVPANTWVNSSYTFTVPAGGSMGTTLYFHNPGGPTVVGAVVYLDAVVLD